MFVITRRKFYVTLKRDILQSSCQKIPVMEFVFNEIAGIDCRPETEKELPTRGFSVDASGFLTLLQSSLTWAPFLVKLETVHLRTATLLKAVTP